MQLVLTSHSPYFVNELSPEEVWILFRNAEGYTQAVKASEIRGIRELIEEGGKLGQLWAEGHFGVGDPLAPDQMVSPYDKDVKKKRGGA
jgi:hypothetical protein